MNQVSNDLAGFLNEMVVRYNHPCFIDSDPISVPHRYDCKEDVEIAAFLAATISWGNRKSIVHNAHKMLDLLGESPMDFVLNHKNHQLSSLEGFVHRTFNGIDFTYFIKSLQNIYQNHNGLEAVFVSAAAPNSLQQSISKFKNVFFELPHPPRTRKHISDPSSGSAAKRLNMMLRWLVRRDGAGVDLGIWKQLQPCQLSCPLDVHSGNTARQLGLLNRKQNDAKALYELDSALRLLDPKDPVKYDFALFGLGVFEKNWQQKLSF
jgi:uncharacterized protein (TIGR02757 family)